jgi:hypothetical protein
LRLTLGKAVDGGVLLAATLLKGIAVAFIAYSLVLLRGEP